MESVDQFYQPFDDYAANQNKDLSVIDGELGNIKATIWKNVAREETVLRNDLFVIIQGSVRRMAQRHLIQSE